MKERLFLVVDIKHLIQTYDKGFLVLSENQEGPTIISDLDNLIINEETIVDIALIDLGLSQHDDELVSF